MTVVRASRVMPGDMVRGLHDRRIVTGCPVRIKRVYDLPNGKRRFTYVIPGPFTTGWKDVSPDRPMTLEVYG